MLALGQSLVKRGHRVVVLTNPVFEDMVRAAGLTFDAIGHADDQAQTVAHPKLWHPVDGLGVMWRYLLRPALEPTFERLAEWSAQGPCVVLTHPLAMGARVAQEKLGLNVVSVYTAPTLLRSVHPPLTMAQWQVPRWMPRLAVQGVWQAFDRFKLQPLVKPALEGMRQAKGLGPVKGSVFGQWMHSPQAGVALFPAWFSPAPPDWPSHVVQTDFVRYEEHHEGRDAAMPMSLQTFLERGEAPVVFMPGTARQSTDTFFTEAVQACSALGLRAVLLGHLSAAVQARVSENSDAVWSGPYVPFARLLPHARALVHHGGIGTSAQALHAGVAQLVVPSAYDQFDNAMRLQRLGVADVLLNLHPRHMQGALQALLRRPDVRSACLRWAGQGRPMEACERVCELVEGWL